MPRHITDVAKVIRSKNAGPYELTLDIIFNDRTHYALFKDRALITKKRIANLYRIEESEIISIIWFPPANAVKVTMKRWAPSGAPGERDIYGAQQHAPIFSLSFDED